jgi:hypothetical protein
VSKKNIDGGQHLCLLNSQIKRTVSTLELLFETYQEQICSILPAKLIFENGQYGTTENNPILFEPFNIDADFKQITASEIGDRYASVAGTGFEPVPPNRTLQELKFFSLNYQCN